MTYYHTDERGTVLVRTDEDGNRQWPAAGVAIYNPFGESFHELDDDLHYCGKRRTEYTKQWEFGARTLESAWTCRWNQPDPVRGRAEIPLSWNRYSYCGNDPVNFVDQDGKRFTYPQDNPGNSRNGPARQAMVNHILSLDTNSQAYKDVLTLYESDVIYNIVLFGGRPGDTGEGGRTGAITKDGLNQILIHVNAEHKWPLDMRLRHEIRHGVQFETGKLAFTNSRGYWEPVAYDLTDELDAFIAQIEGYSNGQTGEVGLLDFARRGHDSQLKWLSCSYPKLSDKREDLAFPPERGIWYGQP